MIYGKYENFMKGCWQADCHYKLLWINSKDFFCWLVGNPSIWRVVSGFEFRSKIHKIFFNENWKQNFSKDAKKVFLASSAKCRWTHRHRLELISFLLKLQSSWKDEFYSFIEFCFMIFYFPLSTTKIKTSLFYSNV